VITRQIWKGKYNIKLQAVICARRSTGDGLALGYRVCTEHCTDHEVWATVSIATTMLSRPQQKLSVAATFVEHVTSSIVQLHIAKQAHRSPIALTRSGNRTGALQSYRHVFTTCSKQVELQVCVLQDLRAHATLARLCASLVPAVGPSHFRSGVADLLHSLNACAANESLLCMQVLQADLEVTSWEATGRAPPSSGTGVGVCGVCNRSKQHCEDHKVEAGINTARAPCCEGRACSSAAANGCKELPRTEKGDAKRTGLPLPSPGPGVGLRLCQRHTQPTNQHAAEMHLMKRGDMPACIRRRSLRSPSATNGKETGRPSLCKMEHTGEPLPSPDPWLEFCDQVVQ
jgi:hypothetical protein